MFTLFSLHGLALRVFGLHDYSRLSSCVPLLQEQTTTTSLSPFDAGCTTAFVDVKIVEAPKQDASITAVARTPAVAGAQEQEDLVPTELSFPSPQVSSASRCLWQDLSADVLCSARTSLGIH